LALADEVKASRRARPDIIVWPENSSDVDPHTNADAAQRITTAARAVGTRDPVNPRGPNAWCGALTQLWPRHADRSVRDDIMPG
jgi:hypothetical protein